LTTVTAENPGTEAVLRPHAEQEYAAELAALAAGDDRERPPGWRLSSCHSRQIASSTARITGPTNRPTSPKAASPPSTPAASQ